jgi:hypothetical protein
MIGVKLPSEKPVLQLNCRDPVKSSQKASPQAVFFVLVLSPFAPQMVA